MKEFTKLCPKCERPQYYGCKNSLLYAIENNKIRPLAFFRYNEKQRHLYDVLESVG